MNYDKAVLFEKFSNDLEDALEIKISLNPILNSFQETYHKYSIDKTHGRCFYEEYASRPLQAKLISDSRRI